MPLSVAPHFDANRNVISFNPEGVNQFMEEKILDNFDFYQGRYSLYTWMRLNRLQKYTLHWMKGNPFLWQKHNSCSWDPIGGISWGKKTLEPCPGKLNVKQCYDSLLNSCFRSLLDWNNGGPVQMRASVLERFNRIIGRNAALGARMTLTVGQKYDTELIKFKEKAPDNIRELFQKTMNTCRGWIELLEESAKKAGYEHLNQKDLIKGSDWNGRKFIGSVFELADNLELPANLEAVLTEGGMAGTDDDGNPVIYTPYYFCDPRIFSSLRTQINAQSEDLVANKKRRLTSEEVAHLNGTLTTYKLDGIPIVPINDLAQAEKYTLGHTGLFGLTVSGNIALGGSFAAIPEVMDNEGKNVGIRVQYHGDNDKLFWSWLSHALFRAAINDAEMIAASQGFFEPATAA